MSCFSNLSRTSTASRLSCAYSSSLHRLLSSCKPSSLTPMVHNSIILTSATPSSPRSYASLSSFCSGDNGAVHQCHQVDPQHLVPDKEADASPICGTNECTFEHNFAGNRPTACLDSNIRHTQATQLIAVKEADSFVEAQEAGLGEMALCTEPMEAVEGAGYSSALDNEDKLSNSHFMGSSEAMGSVDLIFRIVYSPAEPRSDIKKAKVEDNWTRTVRLPWLAGTSLSAPMLPAPAFCALPQVSEPATSDSSETASQSTKARTSGDTLAHPSYTSCRDASSASPPNPPAVLGDRGCQTRRPQASLGSMQNTLEDTCHSMRSQIISRSFYGCTLD
ncbi:unnamed protein product [Protopolystoma xenopodis]|uniref:Uncharacterized protein n=1 Tax=Protopolystoma xenopodis TaxID=117903 RepID=A0A3S5B820_9PLAT|nr:unnamed protein product [Protopolystoma xenopodis]